MPKHATLDETGKLKTEIIPPVVSIFTPPEGMLRVVNLYVDPEIKRLVWEYEDTPNLPGDFVYSNPPPGKCRVTNAFVDPQTGKLVLKWDDTPIP